jgi:hypothetical protein
MKLLPNRRRVEAANGRCLTIVLVVPATGGWHVAKAENQALLQRSKH